MHLELFAHRRVVIVPAGIGVDRTGCVYPARTLEPTGVVEVAHGSTPPARRPLPDLGPAARAAMRCSPSARRRPSVPTSAAAASRGPPPRSRSRPAPRSSSSSVRTCRLTGRTSSRGGRREGTPASRRAPSLARGHPRSRAAADRRRRASRRSAPRARTSSTDFTPVRRARAGQAHARLVRDPAARRAADHPLQARLRASHRRPHDLRALRPVDDRPSAPAGRRRRDDFRRGDVPRARPLPDGRRCLPGDRAASEPPALPVRHRRGQGEIATAAGLQQRGHDGRLPLRDEREPRA